MWIMENGLASFEIFNAFKCIRCTLEAVIAAYVVFA
jgi:hypothetical protein